MLICTDDVIMPTKKVGCRPVRVKPFESSMDDPPADKNATGKAKGHAFDPTDVRVYEFFIQGAPNPKDLEGVEEDQLLDIQRTIQEKLKERDTERERNITKRMKQYEQKYDFINKALLESIAQITEMAKSDHPTATARVILADKMVILLPLFEGSKPEVATQHYERFNQYIKFQTKCGNIRELVVEAIDFFEHALDKKALVWFQEHKDKFVDLTTLKTMFLQRYNPWGKTKQDQLQSWNILIFYPQMTDADEHIDLINTLGDLLGQTEESNMEKFIDTMPTIIIGGSRGCAQHMPPLWDPILSFLHTFSPKSAHIRGPCPPNGCMPPLWEILDPPLIIQTHLITCKT